MNGAGAAGAAGWRGRGEAKGRCRGSLSRSTDRSCHRRRLLSAGYFGFFCFTLIAVLSNGDKVVWDCFCNMLRKNKDKRFFFSFLFVDIYTRTSPLIDNFFIRHEQSEEISALNDKASRPKNIVDQFQSPPEQTGRRGRRRTDLITNSVRVCLRWCFFFISATQHTHI